VGIYFLLNVHYRSQIEGVNISRAQSESGFSSSKGSSFPLATKCLLMKYLSRDHRIYVDRNMSSLIIWKLMKLLISFHGFTLHCCIISRDVRNH